MRKLLILITLLIAATVQAQDYKPFKVNVSVGYANPSGLGVKAGVLFGIEPKYNIQPRIEVGLRLESALMIRGVEWDVNNHASTGVTSGLGSAVLTGNYLFGPFGDSNFRPFVGVGLGIFHIASGGSVPIYQNQTNADLPLTEYSTIGGLVRAGIKVGHFVVGIDFNAIPDHVYKLTNSPVEYTTKSSYTGFRLGFDLGGGRR
ncbi:hypothetical protein GCM10027592_27030 [Spirosoma flavus]